MNKNNNLVFGLLLFSILMLSASRTFANPPLAKVMQIKPADLSTTIQARSDTILKKIITGRGKQTITGRDRHNLLSKAMPEWKDIFSDEQLQKPPDTLSWAIRWWV